MSKTILLEYSLAAKRCPLNYFRFSLIFPFLPNFRPLFCQIQLTVSCFFFVFLNIFVFFPFFGAAFSFFGSAFSFYLFYYYFGQALLSPVKHLSTHTGPRVRMPRLLFAQA